MSKREQLYDDVQAHAHEFVGMLDDEQVLHLWSVLTLAAHRASPMLFAKPPEDTKARREQVGDFLTDVAFGQQEDEP